jgi:hypothetical protein
MLTFTSGEFTLILSLLEILFPNLCLFLFINVYIKIHNSYKCVCWFLRLVLDQSMCRRKFGFISFIFIFICTNSLNVARNAFICVHLICSGSNLLLAVQISVPWSVGLVGTVGQVLRCDWLIKD